MGVSVPTLGRGDSESLGVHPTTTTTTLGQPLDPVGVPHQILGGAQPPKAVKGEKIRRVLVQKLRGLFESSLLAQVGRAPQHCSHRGSPAPGASLSSAGLGPGAHGVRSGLGGSGKDVGKAFCSGLLSCGSPAWRGTRGKSNRG